MSKYKFYIDEKVSIWNRLVYEIEAENENDAIRLAKLECKDPSYNEDYGFCECKPIIETEQFLEPGDNSGYATRELFNEDMEKIGDNLND